MTDENRRRNVKLEIEEAERCFRAAEALLAIDLPKDALNRLYYASYHLALAVLLTEGLEPRSHRGLHSLLGSEFVRPGRLPAAVQHVISRLSTYREYADYDRDFVATRELVEEETAAARGIHDTIRAFLSAAGY